MEYLEELGLLKMDFLALRNLTIIQNVLELIESETGKKIDLSKIPLDDKETINIGGKEVNYGKIGDIVKQYSTLVGMGYSTLSGLSNVTMGGAQLLIEAAGGEFFNLKDLAKAQKIFFENLPDILKDAYSDYPQTKIGLIFRYFDVEEDFYNEASDTDSSKSAYKKVICIVLNGANIVGMPLISKLSLDLNILVNLVSVSTKELNGVLYGNITIGVDSDETLLKIRKYLAEFDGIEVEEVR